MGGFSSFGILKRVTCSRSVCPVPLRFNIAQQTWGGEISLRVRVSTFTLRWEQVSWKSVKWVSQQQQQHYGIGKRKKSKEKNSQGYLKRLQQAHPKLFYPLQAQPISSRLQPDAQSFIQGSILSSGCTEPWANHVHTAYLHRKEVAVRTKADRPPVLAVFKIRPFIFNPKG